MFTSSVPKLQKTSKLTVVFWKGWVWTKTGFGKKDWNQGAETTTKFGAMRRLFNDYIRSKRGEG